MAESLTIARPYAEAAFKLASEQGNLAAWGELLANLATISSDSSAKQLSSSPSIGSEQVASTLAGMLGELNDQQRNFVQVLAENRRLMVMPEIATLYNGLRNQAEGAVEAIVQSAYELTDAQLADIVATLESKTGRKVNARVELAPELIGGVSIRIGDEVMDASVRGKLSQLAASLKV
ncbi:MAG: F0F1 ATP synthase subunit delta [Burkholderiaceae bacterium]